MEHLIDLFPREGFRWHDGTGRGPPRILRNGKRDAQARKTLRRLLKAKMKAAGRKQKPNKHDFQHLMVSCIDRVTECVQDKKLKMLPYETEIMYLGRIQPEHAVSRSLEYDIWLELMAKLVDARFRYLLVTPGAQRRGNVHQKPGLAYAIDEMLLRFGNRWEQGRLIAWHVVTPMCRNQIPMPETVANRNAANQATGHAATGTGGASRTVGRTTDQDNYFESSDSDSDDDDDDDDDDYDEENVEDENEDED